MNLWTFFSFHIEHYALKDTFYVQCYSVLSSSTAHKSVNGVNFYNILHLNDNLDVKVVELDSVWDYSNKPLRFRPLTFCTREVIFFTAYIFFN